MIELVLAFLIFGGLGFVLVIINKLLGPKKTNPTKEMPFECGSPYLEKEIRLVSIPFFLVALIFLLFDVEVIFIFPWALVIKKMGFASVLAMGSYIGVLSLGFIYAWKKGLFEWE